MSRREAAAGPEAAGNEKIRRQTLRIRDAVAFSGPFVYRLGREIFIL